MSKRLRSKLLKGRGGADVDFQNAPLLQERSGCSEMAVRKSWELLRTIVKDGKTRSCIFFHSFPLQNVRLRGLQSCIACSCDVPSLWTMMISCTQLVLKRAYFEWIVSDLGALGAGWHLSPLAGAPNFGEYRGGIGV